MGLNNIYIVFFLLYFRELLLSFKQVLPVDQIFSILSQDPLQNCRQD